MSRATRVEFEGALYHVMARGVGRMTTFKDDEDHLDFLERVAQVVEDGGLIVHAFCLMPNHYHLLASTPGGQLGRWMRQVNGPYAQRFNRRYRREGHGWQGRYKAILVDRGDYLLECSRYIHLNPNRARITRPAERYRWSSYRNYVGGPAVVPWVETRLTLGELGGDGDAYRAFVESGRGERAVSPFERAVAGLALGGEAFVRRVVERLSGADGRERPAVDALRGAAKLEPAAVEALVDEVFPASGPARRRRLKLYALRRYSGLRPSAIARRHGRTPAAVSLACRDLEAAATDDPELAAGLRSLAAAVEAETCD
jgi:putative transposase